MTILKTAARETNEHDAVTKKTMIDQSTFDIAVAESRDHAFKAFDSNEKRHFGLFRFNSD